MNTLAVVIPTRNMAQHLGRCIGSVCHGGADEIVVIDDASEDDTPVVVEHWQNQFPQVQYIRHAEKLADHNAAQRDVWLSLKSDQVVGIGADDYLYPGAITALKAHASSPVVFGDADATDEHGRFLCPHMSNFYGDRKAGEVCERLQGPSNLIESGCGSALRIDMARMLWCAGWEQLGPLMDSVGYAAVAALHGATYLKRKTVNIMVSSSSYGSRDSWTNEAILPHVRAAIGLMEYLGLDNETIKAIGRKRCYLDI